VIADKTKPDGDSHYTFDLESAREITHEEHAKAVRYSSGSGFAADVVPVRAAGSVREWKAAGSKYIPIAEQQAAPHAGEALMDTNKMRDISREQFESFAREVLDWSDDEFRLASDGKSYYWGSTGEAWVFWQASRAAIVVELPSPMDAPPYASYEGGWNDMRDEAVDGIEEQGLKVKAREVQP